MKTLINDGIIKSIEDNEKAGNITHDDTIVLIALLEKLYIHLYGGIKKFKEEGVRDMLTEKLILDIDRVMYRAEKEKEKAEAKAEARKALEIAKNMLDGGMTIDEVAKFTKLPLNKIKRLQIPK